jgi:quinol-cytochrome oxidoreductase complex cytochrome b subunit
VSTVKPPDPRTPGPGQENWTARTREYGLRSWPPERMLPDREPNYVASSLYVFGVLTIAAFATLVVSGLVLSVKGPLWWHDSSVGRFFNDVHFWGVQLFFFAVFIHIFTVFFAAAWRNGRRVTWLVGAVLFFVAITTGLSGYVSVTSWESQWIALSAKDLINSIGLGGVVNVLDTGQMLTLHVVLLPLAMAGLIIWHVLLVRRHGVVEPLGSDEDVQRDLARRVTRREAPAAPAGNGGGNGAPATPKKGVS